jgi:CheY-like chemotaxis protein
MTEHDNRVREVLLVDDNAADLALISDVFRSYPLPTRVHTAADGVEALAFLRRQGGHADAPRPDLILLDLNMPRMDGRQVLVAVKTDPQLGTIPLVVFTASTAAADITASYTAHANAYLVKPRDLGDLERAIHSLYCFFGELVSVPPNPPDPQSNS